MRSSGLRVAGLTKSPCVRAFFLYCAKILDQRPLGPRSLEADNRNAWILNTGLQK